MTVYVSTSCLADESNVFDVLEVYSRAGFRRVELGSRHKYLAPFSPADFRSFNFDYLIHNYFPPPEKLIILNLASQNPAILRQSLLHMKRAIDFCHSLDIGLFTFHAGFCLDPDEKLCFPREQSFNYEASFNTFIESVDEINCYAQQKGVRIAIENNVLAEYNMVNGHNQFLLLCRAEEFERLWNGVPSDNVGMLLDLGHLKVSSHWLQFDRYEFIDRIKDRVFALHLHENNGQVDQHAALDGTSWCWQVISDDRFDGLPLILESSQLDIEQIIHQVWLMENILGDR
jgi:sugar phosphate isomerase/epimerase